MLIRYNCCEVRKVFHEKLKYYRKKNMLTQEDLSEKLNVSRQIITKWESGDVLPSLEYLIDLSVLFKVTIDTLIKDDDCMTIDKKDMNVNELNVFLSKAKQETYASKKGKVSSSRLASHDYIYQDGRYRYLDSFVGNSKFSGEEVVYENDIPIWSMNYYGRVIGENFEGDFLKEALKHVPIDKPYRGPDMFINGEYCYHNRVEEDEDCFHGCEEIFYQSEKIYECFYHGGKIE